ncbi:MCR_0457 family protein [Acinetobacter larvae]|uniref:DUF7944 domain-containing protein n=1 Tax=Acinetobacter larvae TaxID=1789224 RepID=A0A1B2M1A3_9GAMM|nr:hypothetical protein [Acinetobacter larvae]AOA58977.1 hypothetical protein BFG52_11865 [Acinetobacter larvae]
MTNLKDLIKNCSKAITLGTFSISCLLSATLFAAENNENIEVTQVQVTSEELAAIYVLSEICPKFVKGKKFDQGYAALVADYLPDSAKPLRQLQQIAQNPQFKKFLDEARQDAQKAGDDKNRAVCQDIEKYQSY